MKQRMFDALVYVKSAPMARESRMQHRSARSGVSWHGVASCAPLVLERAGYLTPVSEFSAET